MKIKCVLLLSYRCFDDKFTELMLRRLMNGGFIALIDKAPPGSTWRRTVLTGFDSSGVTGHEKHENKQAKKCSR